AHAGILVEGRHANRHLRLIVGVAAEKVGAAARAEALLEAAVRVPPDAQRLRPSRQAEAAPIDPRLRRRCGARSALAARAVAVARLGGALAQLEANGAAQAAAVE